MYARRPIGSSDYAFDPIMLVPNRISYRGFKSSDIAVNNDAYRRQTVYSWG